MGAKVQHRVGSEVFPQVTVKRRERMCGCKATLEQQAHRVAFVTKRRLNCDQHITKLVTHDKDGLAIAELFAGSWAPLGFDLGQMAFATHMVFCTDQAMYIGISTVLAGIALQNFLLQVLHRFGHVDRVALGFHGEHGVEQRLENTQVSRGARVACVGREIEDHHRYFALGMAAAAQGHHLGDALGQHRCALGTGEHIFLAVLFGESAALGTAGASHAVCTWSSAIDHGYHRTI